MAQFGAAAAQQANPTEAPPSDKTHVTQSAPAGLKREKTAAPVQQDHPADGANLFPTINPIALQLPIQEMTVVSPDSQAQGDNPVIAAAGTNTTAAAQPHALPAGNEAAVINAAQPANTNSAVSSPAPQGPLSFAAKLDAPQNADGSAPDNHAKRMVLSENVTTVASAWKKSQHEAHDGHDAEAPETQQPAAALSKPGAETIAPAISAPVTPAPALHAVSHPTTPLAAVREIESPVSNQPQTTNTQFKDLSFRISQPGGSPVDLRLVQRSGELKVAVHSASPELSQQLRDNLPELSKKFSDSGVHSELWRPGVSAPTATTDSQATKNQDPQPQGGDPQYSSGGGNQERRQRNQQQADQPQWVEELQNGIHSAFPSTGEIHGLRS